MKNIVIILLGIVLFLQSCEKDSGFDAEEFNTLIENLEFLNQPDEIPEPIEVEVIVDEEPSGDYICSVKRYKAAPGYNELFLMDPTSDVIYPGALIKGESIPTGEYIPIIAERKPVTISVSLQNIEGSPARTIDDPKLSTVREAINEILSSDVTGATPARISFEIEEVFSQEQLEIAVAGNYKNSFVDVAGSFDFSKENIRSRLVVKFLQIYYTIDMDPPKNPDDLFKSTPDISSLGSTSPLYVSTVTYGRMVLFTVESSYSSMEMNAALNAAFSAGVSSGSVDVNAKYSKIINNSTVKAFILGGSGSSAVQSVNGISGIVDFITNGGDYSKDSPGAALSYKLRYLKDNSVANIILSSEYNVRQCQRIFSNYKVELLFIECVNCDDAGSEAEMMGFLAVSMPDGSQLEYLWYVLAGNAQRVIPDIGGILEIYTNTEITLTNASEESYIVFGGHLWEDDLTGDDDLGETIKNVYLADFNSPVVLLFNGDGNIAKAHFLITPLDYKK